MKKYALLFVFACLLWTATAFAGQDIKVQGVVMQIDSTGKTISLKEVGGKNITLLVTPATEFELKAKDSPTPDQKVSFSALQIDDWIKAECTPPSSDKMIVEDVNIYR